MRRVQGLQIHKEGTDTWDALMLGFSTTIKKKKRQFLIINSSHSGRAPNRLLGYSLLNMSEELRISRHLRRSLINVIQESNK